MSPLICLLAGSRDGSLGKNSKVGVCILLPRMQHALAKTGLEKQPLLFFFPQVYIGDGILLLLARHLTLEIQVNEVIKCDSKKPFPELFGNTSSKIRFVSEKSCSSPAMPNAEENPDLWSHVLGQVPIGVCFGNHILSLSLINCWDRLLSWLQRKRWAWWPPGTLLVIHSQVLTITGVVLAWWNYLVGEREREPHQRQGNHRNFSFGWLMKL